MWLAATTGPAITGALNLQASALYNNGVSAPSAPTPATSSYTILAGANQLAASTVVSFGLSNTGNYTTGDVEDGGADANYAFLELSGQSITVGGLSCPISGLGVIEQSESIFGYGAVTLTINNSSNYRYAGILRDTSTTGNGAVAVTKTGAGEQILYGGGITYTGPTTISGGTLTLQDCSYFASSITNNATLNLMSYWASWVLPAPTVSGSGSLTKTGSLYVVMRNTNTYTGPTIISAGALQANNGVGLPANSLLKLDGGVLQADGDSTVTFTRTLGTAAGNFQWTANGGGFSGSDGGGPMIVRVNNGTSTLTWGNTVGANIVGPLKFGSVGSAQPVTFQNGINLNGAARTINVTDNAYLTTDYANISGAISGSGGIVKTGGGMLYLSNTSNSYTGGATVSGGILAATSTSAPGPINIKPQGGFSPGDPYSVGSVTTGNATWNAGGRYLVETQQRYGNRRHELGYVEHLGRFDRPRRFGVQHCAGLRKRRRRRATGEFQQFILILLENRHDHDDHLQSQHEQFGRRLRRICIPEPNPHRQLLLCLGRRRSEEHLSQLLAVWRE